MKEKDERMRMIRNVYREGNSEGKIHESKSSNMQKM